MAEPDLLEVYAMTHAAISEAKKAAAKKELPLEVRGPLESAVFHLEENMHQSLRRHLWDAYTLARHLESAARAALPPPPQEG